MVTGWSGIPETDNSCTSAWPLEVTRSENCANLPSTVGSCGKVVSWPTHEPARVFSLSKDFCASDGTTGVCMSECAGGFCASDCANAKVESNIRTTDRTKHRDFMFHSP